jgi:diguanylate cyclase (GGDEF)-like protein
MTPVAWQPADGVLQILLVGQPSAGWRPLTEALAQHGEFAATACATARDAAARLAAQPVDCVVAAVNAGAVLGHEVGGARAGDIGADDTGAPDHNADAALERAVAMLRGTDAEVPVIALGDLGPGGAEAAQAGAQDHVARIGDGDALARAIRHAVERRRTSAAMAESALHDLLTGLPNRALLADRITNAFSRLPRSGRKLAVLCVALDGFKLVNDSLGHTAGDELLVQVGRRLQAVMRPSDTVARLGGDVFAVLCDEMDPAAEPEPIARRILAALTEPFLLSAGEHHAAASVGIAVGQVGDDAARVLRQADAAMTAAKRQGGGCAHYEAAMGATARKRLALHNELHSALDRNELVLHYQPQVPLGGGAATGVEALVRWEHPERGLVPPGDFIPLAEASGLIVPIGRWVLREACSQLARWTERGGRLATLEMGVNLSARQLAHPSLVDDVAEILAETGADPSRVCLEITETAVLDDAGLATERLRALKALGVRLAIDDFGTGYSSLSQLGRFPVDVLKIDRSFVQAMGEGGAHPRGRGVVAAVITLARAMGLVPLAEGVEREAQAEVLRALGCPAAQGYLFSAARTAEDVERVILAGPDAQAPVRVVVCDDAPALRALMRASLELDGRVEVVGEAEDGERVVDLSAELRPDVVLLDLQMPGVDGLSALPRIRRAAPDTAVVVLSGCDAAEVGSRALALGARRYVEKPAGITAIRDAILGA